MLFADLFYMCTLWFEDRIRFVPRIGSFHVDEVTNQVHVISILFNVKVSLCFYKAFFLLHISPLRLLRLVLRNIYGAL